MTKSTRANPFILPKKSAFDSNNDEYDGERLKQSISDLPIGNVSETTRTLHRELKRLNKIDMSPIERYEAIQLMLPALVLMLEKMRGHLVTKAIPLSVENKLIAKLHLELLVGIVVAYKMVMAQLHDESFTGHLLHKHTRSEALRRALFFLGEILLYEYSAYSTSPKYVWQEIHGIHHYAVINDLRLKEKDIDSDRIVGNLTVDEIYKRILLLGLADSGELLRGEIKRISDVMTDWLSAVSLLPIDHNFSSFPVFALDATRDAPPYVAVEADVQKIKIGWVLSVEKLDLILEEKIDELKEKSKGKLRPVDLIPATLYSKLRKRWTPELIVREERSEAHGTINMTCGMESLHWVFGGWRIQRIAENDSADKADFDEETMYDKPALNVEQDEFLINVDAELYAAIAAETGQVEEQKASSSDGQDELDDDFNNALVEDEPKQEEYSCVNQSRRGYCLAWSGEDEYKAHVGELVGISSSDVNNSESSWSLGVIRWIRAQSNGLVGFGVEIFDGDIQAIQLDYHHSDDSVGDTVIGFLQKRNGSVETLITKPFFYGDGDKLLLTSANGQVPVVPGKIVECTDAFMRFKVRFDSGVVDKKIATSNVASVADDLFNNIWEDL